MLPPSLMGLFIRNSWVLLRSLEPKSLSILRYGHSSNIEEGQRRKSSLYFTTSSSKCYQNKKRRVQNTYICVSIIKVKVFKILCIQDKLGKIEKMLHCTNASIPIKRGQLEIWSRFILCTAPILKQSQYFRQNIWRLPAAQFHFSIIFVSKTHKF